MVGLSFVCLSFVRSFDSSRFFLSSSIFHGSYKCCSFTSVCCKFTSPGSVRFNCSFLFLLKSLLLVVVLLDCVSEIF